MGKKVLSFLAAVVLVLSFVSCKKKEEKPIAPAAPQPGVMMPPGETQVVVPDFVQGKWKSVTLAIENKETNTTKDVKVDIGGEYQIPDTKIKIKVNDFLPDFIMDGLTITSKSAELNNPAANVVISEGDEQLFKGWLYSKYPAIHPFQHEQYGVTLKEVGQEG